MIRGIEHIGLCAHDPETLIEWYMRVLGFRIILSMPERRTYFIQDRNSGIIEIYPSTVVTPQMDNVHSGLRHIAIGITGFEEELTHLKNNGVDIPENMIVQTSSMRLAFFRDPEGNLLHLVEREHPLADRY
jgi:glyoxylase I family protein